MGSDLRPNSVDAIVIGSGITGGWAAKELCEQGFKTLVLERGRNVEHVTDYPTMFMDTWDFKYGEFNSREENASQAKQARTGYVTKPWSRHWFVNDTDHPYNEVKRFDWIRGYHVGGRSITWGRQSYRLSDLDFTANQREGIGVDWPVRYSDIEPWYDYVEKFIGVSGEKLGLGHLPDGQFLPAMELNCAERHLQNKLKEHYRDRILTIGRVANLTDDHSIEGRGRCQFRNRCIRGCPYGAYFSSQSSTLPAAAATGNLTLRPDTIVHSILYDEHRKQAVGVRVIDAVSGKQIEYFARIVFCCASTVATTAILLNSKSTRFPNGLGNDCGELGRNLMDHHFGVGAQGVLDGLEDRYFKGRRPNGIYVPRFRNVDHNSTPVDFIRGYGFQGAGSRGDWRYAVRELTIGDDLKQKLLRPGPWRVGLVGFGEMLPYSDNRMFLNYEKTDKWGLPTVTFDCELKDNELRMRRDMRESAGEMLEKAGFSDVEFYDRESPPGLGIHEMGTARMGRDPRTSVLNAYNQIHSVPNVFVTDGSFMTSSACQNPSLTYMAFTARAVQRATQLSKRGDI